MRTYVVRGPMFGPYRITHIRQIGFILDLLEPQIAGTQVREIGRFPTWAKAQAAMLAHRGTA